MSILDTEKVLPRPVSIIESQLSEFRVAHKSAQEYGARDFASRLALQSMQKHESELVEELKAAQLLESGADAEFSLDGEPVRDHLISTDFIGKFFISLQKLMYSVAQSQQKIMTKTGRRVSDIVRENKLFVPPAFVPGSFSFRVHLLSKEELGITEEPESIKNLCTLSSILDEQVNTDDICEVVSHPRVQTDYANMLNLLAKDNANLCIRRKDSPFAKKITASCARERSRWLDLLEKRVEEYFLEGTIVGGSIESSRFELRTDEDLLRGDLSEQAKTDIKKFHWGDAVRVHVRSEIETNEDNSFEKTHFKAVKIESAAQQDLFR